MCTHVSSDSKRIRLVRLILAATSLGCACAAAAIARADSAPIALSGQAAPVGGTYAAFAPSELSLSNHFAFRASLAGVPVASDTALFRADALVALPAPVQIAREGQLAPGGSGGALAALGAPAIDRTGRLVFRAGVGASENALYRSSDGAAAIVSLTQIARGPVAGGAFSNIADPAASEFGTSDLAFRSNQGASA